MHGNTIIHQPKYGISIQLGKPNFLSKSLNTTVVADFRDNDRQLIIFPNPANLMLTIQSDLAGVVEVFDLHGRHLLSQDISDELILNTQQWENGIYLIQFSSQNGMKEVKKIIIQH